MRSDRIGLPSDGAGPSKLLRSFLLILICASTGWSNLIHARSHRTLTVTGHCPFASFRGSNHLTDMAWCPEIGIVVFMRHPSSSEAVHQAAGNRSATACSQPISQPAQISSTISSGNTTSFPASTHPSTAPTAESFPVIRRFPSPPWKAMTTTTGSPISWNTPLAIPWRSDHRQWMPKNSLFSQSLEISLLMT